MIGVPIDIDRPDAEVMADVRRVWEVCKQVAMGVTPQGDLQQAIAALRTGQAVAATPP